MVTSLVVFRPADCDRYLLNPQSNESRFRHRPDSQAATLGEASVGIGHRPFPVWLARLDVF
jgi:hypothetical protein